jgi:hypothetical protein
VGMDLGTGSAGDASVWRDAVLAADSEEVGSTSNDGTVIKGGGWLSVKAFRLFESSGVCEAFIISYTALARILSNQESILATHSVFTSHFANVRDFQAAKKPGCTVRCNLFQLSLACGQN